MSRLTEISPLFDLLKVSSPSGDEGLLLDIFESMVSPYVSEVSRDVNGNLIAHKKGNGKKVLLMAHSDEIGLQIRYIDDKGFLYFNEIGGIDTNLLPGRKVMISGKRGAVYGVIGKKPVHLQDKVDTAKNFEPEDLWIDIAAAGGNEARKLVGIGDTATIVSEPKVLNNAFVSSRALDDKVGLFVLYEVARHLGGDVNADVYFVASVQEELGARGAQMVTEAIRPDIGIAIDVTHATDYPSMSPVRDGNIILGSGAVVSVGPNMNKAISQQILNTASDNNIRHQVEAFSKPTGTDARMIQVAGLGVPTGLVCVPCRYMHTPNEVVSLEDIESVIQLTIKYLSSIH